MGKRDKGGRKPGNFLMLKTEITADFTYTYGLIKVHVNLVNSDNLSEKLRYWGEIQQISQTTRYQ